MSPSPDAIRSLVASRAEEQLRFVVELCEQNSHTHNKRGTDRVAEMVLDRLGGLFSRHEVVPQTQVGDHHILRTGTAEAVYLVGHLDTVFAPDHPFQSCHLEGDRLHGPGSCDMKGGVAVIVYALKALEATLGPARLPIALILNADEEIGSVTSAGIFERERVAARACLVAECAGPEGEIVLSRNGKLGARLDCHGAGRHVGTGTHEKSSAVLELARKVVDLEALNASAPGVSVNVGRVEGGLGPTTVAGHAWAQIDMRWVEESQGETLLHQAREIVAAATQPGCRSELEVLNSRPAMPATRAAEALLLELEQAGGQLGQAVRREHRRGSSDANFFGSAGVPTLDGFGPVGGDDHTPGEWIRVSSLEDRTALLACFLLRLLERPL